MTAANVAAAVRTLKERFGERLSTAEAVRAQHGSDESWHHPHPPDAVVFAQSTEEVAEIVKTCAERRVPVIPYGTGTGLEGHVLAVRGGVCIDLSQMNAVLEVNAEDLDCRVQAGVTRKALNEYLRDTGLFFPIDPGADASLGGMAATRASGTNAVRYGTMRENVLGLTVVLANGEIIRTARRARKSAAGYDLTRLFVGSEGTLGVITEVSLRLHGQPESVSSAVCAFDNLAGAVNTTIMTIQSGAPIARIEILDETTVDMVNKYSKIDNPVAPTLFVEFHGTEASVAEQVERFREIAEGEGARGFQWAITQEDRNKLWDARHKVYFAARAANPGRRLMSTDVCVPISRLADCLLETRADIDASPLWGNIVGHVGDGNFHVGLAIDQDNAEEVAEAERLHDRMVRRALAMEGTCTGEHGIGLGKIEYLVEELGPAVEPMRWIKRAFDPHNIMNPGKIFHLDAATAAAAE